MASPLLVLAATCGRGLRAQHQLVRALVTSRRLVHRAAARGATKDRPPADFDSFGTWDSRWELPLALGSSIKHGKPIPRIDAPAVGISSLQGKRRYQEDRCVAADVAPDLLLTAILDGHGGAECSQFCSQHLVPIVQEQIAAGERNLMAILHGTFPALNRQFAAEWQRGHGAADSPGTTATVCLLRAGAELVIGHVGDSRAILCRDGEARKLTTDHSAALVAEKRRVEQSGGSVVVDELGRHMVNGRLAMTRSIGDLHLKRAGVTAFPDTRSLEVKHGRDVFLVLTSDGINHVMTDQEICDVINASRTPSEGAALLTDQALSYSSDDNISCVVVPFGSWGKFTDRTSIFISFGKTMSGSSRFS
ncbi:protein phosphatase 1K, mitochondrial-like [Pollicipes pollicipes]|uniref:protein phosphatase 1K, mitochondrial-like n=1 Tax=Pollicipes pollicipes TaxID=41117 RepID=UPI00188584A7|nr:protein phosphatase 1K, mitochondrial-like [Pollicipes pollicipes]XP_037069480.1 protein phosphatase 1K, mitochondrial-like [Pollicipes pollicipes]XP_037070970.1 protein phosphatase 1K, mitochondrial-like [Pollicipes pollicipes]XP_037070975.1 protein phosphatase 1K, mitochondrial-like [Pollicipes pollicipes]